MSLEAGTRLASYEIVAPLGRGGMGEVFRARDTTLERDVAIKVLPEGVSADALRLARFEREAKSLAALNHPNIATVHGFESVRPSDGTSSPSANVSFLVMELIEGEDLAKRLERGAMPIEEALTIFEQVAAGLEAAHEAGILHRDLKPANIALTPGSRAKLLDFGLAKTKGEPADPDNLTFSPTLTASPTMQGQILGTAAYMSPEQARGAEIDRRSDIWAFATCLFEALTGRQLFAGDTAADSMARVLQSDPDWDALPASTPLLVERLLRRCLAKDVAKRMRDIGDVRLELEAAAKDLEQGRRIEVAGQVQEPPGASRLTRVTSAIAALSMVVLTWLLIDRFTSSPGAATAAAVSQTTHVAIAPPPGVRFAYRHAPTVAISRNGRRVAFVGPFNQLYVQDLDVDQLPRPVAKAIGWAPFFSPEGDWLAFIYGGQLLKVPLAGGEIKPITEFVGPPQGAWWAHDGSIFFAKADQGIFRVSNEGGTAERVTRGAHFFPQLLPGEQQLLVTTGSGFSVIDLDGGNEVVLSEDGFHARYVANGYLVFAQRDTLLATPFDPAMSRSGNPVPILDSLITNKQGGFAEFAVSDSGALAYFTGSSELERWIVRLEPGKAPVRLNREPRPFDVSISDLSPDGGSFAVSLNGTSDIYVFDVPRGELGRRMTSDAARDFGAIWSPDGRSLAWGSIRDDGSAVILSAPTSGSGDPKQLLSSPGGMTMLPLTWSPDGSELLFAQTHPETGDDILVHRVGASDEPKPFRNSAADETVAMFSPDGKWVAYRSQEFDDLGVYVASYPDAEVVRRVAGGMCNRWSADGRKLYWGAGGGVVMVADVDTSNDLEVMNPRVFVEGIDDNCSWDVAPDGSHVIAIEQRPEPRMVLIQNWFEELEKQVPRNS